MKEKKAKKEKKARKPRIAKELIKTDRRRADGTKPHHKPTIETRGLVKLLTACKRTQEEIADAMHISVDCLRTHYKKEMEEGRILIELKVINAFITLLDQCHPQATIFGAKVFLGLVEKTSIEHTVQELPKIVINVGKPKRGNTDEEE